MFKYGLNLRPAAGGGIPSGYSKVEDSLDFKYGIAFYEEEISFHRIDHFSLTQVDVDIKRFTSLVFEKYPMETLEKYRELNLTPYILDEIKRYICNELRVSLKDAERILASIIEICGGVI